MKIVNDGFEVYESGSLLTTNMKDTKFTLSDEPKLDVVFRIRMDKEKDVFISGELDNNHTFAVVFTNPPKGGYSHASPQKLGYLEGKELYVTFHVEIMGDYAGYNLTYSFFLKEVAHG
ncbi:hypothetical protein WB876_004394 [Vibrio vulnificus]